MISGSRVTTAAILMISPFSVIKNSFENFGLIFYAAFDLFLVLSVAARACFITAYASELLSSIIVFAFFNTSELF